MQQKELDSYRLSENKSLTVKQKLKLVETANYCFVVPAE
jgi:hypothetical protein